MATYFYEAKTSNGEIKKDSMEAESVADAEAKLKAAGLKVTKVRAEGLLDKLSFGGGSPPTRDVVIFTRQFATMIDSGLPLVQCLEIQSQQAQHAGFRKQLKVIKETVEGGATFAEALKKFPETFDDPYVNLVAAGEVGGILDTIMNRLAAYIEKNMKL